ncbi:MAG: hypothetical protein M1832_005916 [Thelocarpon impressellum]|nr:MAG: hypothetical protein M1832_005916 [Thelocarpon impressellum]
MWRLLSSPPPSFDGTISSHGSAFINAITYLPPSSEYSEGLIVSGGTDTIIEVRQPKAKPEDNAEAILLGHSNNVCALDVDPTGGWIVSGGWDGQGRVWSVGKWECETVLEGCADKLIRIYSASGTLKMTIKGHSDVVRSLCRVPRGHGSGADFASASNDATIRLWKMDGTPVGELRGHQNFIYSLGSLPTGELISSGEDRTVRIWKDGECIQTITHPAISVWGVAACAKNGDIVSGASDRLVRVFSRSPERQASVEELKAYDELIKSSSIPQQQVGDVKKENLPGPDFLQQKSGTKEGQVVMIKEANGNVTAHQWSVGSGKWLSIGTVVDAVGSSRRKREHLGKDYDYVFDVDIEDGKPPLKLPYNLSDNPYEAATKFVHDNELPMTYLDQVANFITTNTQGASIGHAQAPQEQPPGADPYGTESRYRPGDVPASEPFTRPKVLPQTAYLSIKQANLKTIQKKLEELNEQLIANGNKEASLNPSDLGRLQALVAHLEQAPAAAAKPSAAVTNGLDLVLRIVTHWPSAQRLPGLDLLRLLAFATPTTATYRSAQGENVVEVLERSGIFDDRERVNNIMLSVRTFANLFETEEGRQLADVAFDKVMSLVQPVATKPGDRNTTIALTTLLINYSVLLTSADKAALPSSSSRALGLLDPLAAVIGSATDSEAIYRALVAAGTLLGLGEEVREAAGSVYGLREKARRAEGKFKEPRVKGVVGEMVALLG